VSTPAKPTGGPGSVFLIDGSNFMFRAFHAPAVADLADGRAGQRLHGFVRMIQALRKEFAPEVFVAVFDHSGATFRNELFPGYKAQRPPPPEDLIPQIPLVRGATAALGACRRSRRSTTRPTTSSRPTRCRRRSSGGGSSSSRPTRT
jgi:5'-3' exonuclease